MTNGEVHNERRRKVFDESKVRLGAAIYTFFAPSKARMLLYLVRLPKFSFSKQGSYCQKPLFSILIFQYKAMKLFDFGAAVVNCPDAKFDYITGLECAGAGQG